MPERVLTKHGFKARKVTPEQEAALDHPTIQRVNILNESFGNVAYAYLSSNPNAAHPHIYLIALNGEVARLA